MAHIYAKSMLLKELFSKGHLLANVSPYPILYLDSYY